MKNTMVDNDTTADLFRAAQAGDRAAFDKLVARTGDRLRATAKARIGSRLGEKLDPEDVVQETYVRAFCAIEKIAWQGAASFDAWLRAIAENLILNAARRHRQHQELRLDADVPARGASEGRRLRRHERFDRLKASLAQLSEDHRKVVMLARIEGLKMEEIARRMNRSVSSVRNLLLRAMKQLRGSLGETGSLGLPDRSLEEEGFTDER